MVLEEFLNEWRSDSPVIRLHTSGSTGAPKEILVSKERMLLSARRTCDFLNLRPDDRALLCLPLDYIAGKMMVVRSVERHLRLSVVPPSAHPLSAVADDQWFDFCAMVPLQVAGSLDVPHEAHRLRQIRHLIIGGGAIDQSLEQRLHDLPNALWSSYGMTETLSHIALRRLNGPHRSDWYTPFDGIRLHTDGQQCLVIEAPGLCSGPLVTNDIAVLRNALVDGRSVTQFRIRGRRDNVVCSGGLKIQIEEVEDVLRAHLQAPFLLSARPDPKLGEALVLLSEDSDLGSIRLACRRLLPKYHVPRLFVHVSHIPLTPTGKPARAEARRIAEQGS